MITPPVIKTIYGPFRPTVFPDSPCYYFRSMPSSKGQMDACKRYNCPKQAECMYDSFEHPRPKYSFGTIGNTHGAMTHLNRPNKRNLPKSEELRKKISESCKGRAGRPAIYPAHCATPGHEDRPSRAKGLCKSCYMKQQRGKDK